MIGSGDGGLHVFGFVLLHAALFVFLAAAAGTGIVGAGFLLRFHRLSLDGAIGGAGGSSLLSNTGPLYLQGRPYLHGKQPPDSLLLDYQ